LTNTVTGDAATTILAATDTVAYTLGRLSIPFAGVVLVILGVVYLLRDGRTTPPLNSQQQGYMPQQQYPPKQVWPQPVHPPPAQHYPNQSHQSPPGHSAGPPYLGAMPAVPKSSQRKTGIVLLAVGGLILFSTVLQAVERVGQSDKTSSTRAKSDLSVGKCHTDTEAFKGNFAASDCSDPTAVIEVASRSDDGKCPDGKSGAGSLYSGTTDGKTTYCFILNLQQGRCYAGQSASMVLKLDDCAAHRSTKVTKRVDGSSDVSVCSGSAKSMMFPEPARVYCLDQS
jgi:hypothetical protein